MIYVRCPSCAIQIVFTYKHKKFRSRKKISNVDLVLKLDRRQIGLHLLGKQKNIIKLIAFTFICLPDEDKRSLKLQGKDHQRNVEGGFQSKKDDKIAARRSWEGKMRKVESQLQLRRKDAVDLLAFDFQQNLATPNLTHQEMFYARQLWTYNFGVHDCLANKGYMFMWPETTTK